MSNFRPTDRETGFLMPPSVDEWLPERHLARFIVEAVEGLDLRGMSGRYRGAGSASYHPTVLLSILVYGYATGVFSSRKLERATYDSVAFRFIAGNEHPDHDTIATFRRRFLKQIEGLFVEVLKLAREMGVLKLGMVALDGTKIHAKLKALPEELGKPETLLADNGYFSAANVTACEAGNITPLIATGREAHHPSLAERFAAAPAAPQDPTPVQAMAHRLKTPEGKQLYGLRKQVPEPVFGIIKSVLGFRQFLLRGLDRVRGEWSLVTMARNLKRMFALCPSV